MNDTSLVGTWIVDTGRFCYGSEGELNNGGSTFRRRSCAACTFPTMSLRSLIVLPHCQVSPISLPLIFYTGDPRVNQKMSLTFLSPLLTAFTVRWLWLSSKHAWETHQYLPSHNSSYLRIPTSARVQVTSWWKQLRTLQQPILQNHICLGLFQPNTHMFNH